MRGQSDRDERYAIKPCEACGGAGKFKIGVDGLYLPCEVCMGSGLANPNPVRDIPKNSVYDGAWPD